MFRPQAGGRSLTTLMSLEDDPPWKCATAPILRYSKGIWAAHAHPYPYALSFQELRASRDIGFKEQECTDWKTVRGPLSALRSSLKRMSWDMNGFAALVNDFGEDVVLTHMPPPAFLKGMLFRACLRTLERGTCSKANRVCGRLVFDVFRARPRSKRSTPLARGCAKSLVCGAAWTPARALSAGYQVPSTKCVRCLAYEDSEFTDCGHVPAAWIFG